MSDDWIRQQAEENRRARAGGAIFATRKANPTQAARANRLARESGLPADTVERQYIDVDARMKARRRAEAISRAPARTQEWFSNPRNAAAAADDIEKMIEMGMGLAATAGQMAHQRAMVTPPKPRPVKVKPSLMASVTALYGGKVDPGSLDIGAEKVAGNLWAGTLDMAGMAAAAVPDVLATASVAGQLFKPQLRQTASPIRKAAQAEAQRVADANKGDSFITEGLLTGLRSVPLTLGAALTRNPTAGAAAISGLVGFDARERGLEKGMSEGGALAYGLAQAAPEFIFERAPMGELLKIGGSGMMRGIGRYLAREIPGEMATTLSQSFTDWVALPENEDKTLTDWASGLPEELASTALGVISGGTMTGALSFAAQKAGDRIQQRRHVRTIAGAVEAHGAGMVVDQIMDGAKAVTLRENDPEGFRDYVAKVADGTPVENVYLPAAAIRELFQDGGEAEHPLFGQYAEQIEEQLALDGEVVIPLAEVATHLAGKPEWSQLRKRARFTPGGHSEADLAEIEETFKAQMEERVGQAADAAQAEASPTQQVFEDVYNQLIGIGRSPALASRDATAIATQSETRAKSRGTDALTYYKSRNLVFRGPNGESVKPVGRALDAPAVDPVFADAKGPRATTARREVRAQRYAELPEVDEFDALDAVTGKDEAFLLNESGELARVSDNGDGTFMFDNGSQVARFGQNQLLQIIADRKMKPVERQEQTSDRDGRERGADAPLDGTPKVASGGSTFHGPIAGIVNAARAYAEKAGIPFARQAEYAPLDEAFATRLADAYAAMQHQPEDPAVAEAYRDLIEQTRAQYDALVAAGYSFTLFDDDSDPYEGKPWRAMIDLRDNQRLAVYSTVAGFGTDTTFDPVGNPLLADTGLEWPDQTGTMRRVLANDLFRAVHDAFGHGIEGAGFRAQGEENAWQAHARLFTGPALAALTTETRGQNSWLNFGPNGETNREALLADTTFGDQKTGLLPEWAWTENRVGDFDELAQARRLYQESLLPEQARSISSFTLDPDQIEMFEGEDLGAAPDAFTDEELDAGEVEIDGEIRPIYNADGDLISPTPSTLTNFWRWFGDSKMVDRYGRPTVYYHGTKADLQALMPNFAFDPDRGGGTFFFALDTETPRNFAKDYSMDNVLPVYLALENTEEYDADGRMWDEVEIDEYARQEAIDEARNQWKQDKIDAFVPASAVEQTGDNEWTLTVPAGLIQDEETKETFDNEGEAFAELEDREEQEREAYAEQIDEEAVEMAEYELSEEGYFNEDEKFGTSTDDLAAQNMGSRQAVVIDDVDEGSGATQVVIVLGDPTRIKHTQNTGAWNPDDPRILYQDTFYSALERAVEAVSTNRAPAAQWLATLKKAPGVKAEELEWTGLEEWLGEQTGPVEKAEVLRVLEAGAVTVETRVLGEPPFDRDERVRELEEEFWESGRFYDYYEPYFTVDERELDEEEAGGEAKTVWVVQEGGRDTGEEFDDEDEARERADELDQPMRDEAEMEAVSEYVDARISDEQETDAEYRDYSLVPDGDDSYREMLLYFPFAGYDKAPKELGGDYDRTRAAALHNDAPSTHWSAERAVVAHARFHDRRGPKGEKILFLDEIQSDWHQKGREQGYNEPADPEVQERARKAFEEAQAAETAAREEIAPLTEKLHKALLPLAREVARLDLANRLKGREGMLQAEGFEKSADSIVVELRARAEARARIPELTATEPRNASVDDLRYFYSDLSSALRAMGSFEDTLSDETEAVLTAAKEAMHEISDPFQKVSDAKRLSVLREEELNIAENGGNIPNAPFKNTWPMLVMKRVIAWAAEGGYDQVAWIKQGENNGGMNDNVSWFYEKVLPNETNKLIKKYGGKVRTLTVNGLAKSVSPRQRELVDRMDALDSVSKGFARQLGTEEEVRQRWAETRADQEERIATRERAILELEAEREDLARANDNKEPLPGGSVEEATRWIERRKIEAESQISNYRKVLAATADFDALWAMNREYWTLEAEAAQLADAAGTNLGFDITPEMQTAAREGFPLFQRSAGGARGRISGGLISGTDDPTIIDIFKLDDPSTVMHEFGHLMLEELRRDAGLPDAPQSTRDEWATIEAWFADNGFTFGRQPIPTAAHELFARGWERYLMEGKAPVPTLQRVFSSFRDALVKLYRMVVSLNAPITPEVRRVFDLMLATHDEIEAAQDRQGAEARFQSAEQAGMSAPEFEAYRKLADQSRDAAFDEALNRAMATVRKQRTLTHRRERDRLRDEVTERVNGLPVFRALHLLRTGRFLGEPDREPMKVKLDRAWIVDRYGEETLGQLGAGVPLYRENGDDPEIVANMAGFATAEEMVTALVEAEATRRSNKEGGDNRSLRAAAIEDEVNALMDERHGNLLNEEDIEEQALGMVNNATEGEVIAAETRALARRLKEQPTPMSMVREWAKRKIAQGRVVDVASRAAIQRYARAQAKAARAFEAALAEGNIDEAFRQSEIRLLNHALIMEARKAADRIDVIVPRLNRVAQQRFRKSVAQAYWDRAHSLLEKFEFRTRSQRELSDADSFAVWAAKEAEKGVDVIAPPRLEQDGTHYTRMSVEELIALDDSVQQLLHLGRRLKTVLDARDQRLFEEARDEGLAVVEGIPQKARSGNLNPSRFDRLKNEIASWDAALLKMEQVFDWLDDGNPNGFFNTMIFRPLAEAQRIERERVGDMLGAVRELMQAVPKKTIKKWEDSYKNERLLDRKTGQPFAMQRQDLIAMALNIGNEGNFDKLAGGYGWNRETIMDVLTTELTQEEWRFVQGVWDLVDTLWPEIEALEKRVNGIAPEKVEARSFEVNGVPMRGGYYPVVYDPARNYTTEQLEAKNTDELFPASYQRASTRQGFTKERTNVQDRAILLSLGTLNRHLTEVLHDLTHREIIMQADRILSDRKVVAAVDDALGPEIRKEFRPWLAHIANEWAREGRELKRFDKWAKRLRTHSTIIGMGLRLSSILSQVAGYAGIVEKIGPLWWAAGMRAYGNPIDSFRFVTERSQEVRYRMDNLERDIASNARELVGKYGALSNVRRYAFFGIAAMDRMVVTAGWMGAYQKAMSEGMSEADAAYYADKVIRTTQGSGGAKDLAAIQRDSEWLKLATMFYSFANAYYNRQRALGRDVRQAKAGDIPALVGRGFLLFVVGPILGQLPGAIMGGYGPDEDEDETWLGWGLRLMAANMFYGIPIARDIASSAASGFDYQFTPASRAIETVMRSVGDVRAITDDVVGLDPDEETEPGKRAVKTGVEAVGYVARLPVGQVSNASQFMVDWANGDADPDGVGDWLKGLQRGKLEE